MAGQFKWVFVVLLSYSFTPNALATNQVFQDFFFNVCSNPSGILLTRCAETDGALGNLSSDSESSLNPSQVSSSLRGRESLAQNKTQQAGAASAMSNEASASEGALSLGPLSILINTHSLQEDLDARVDVDLERGYELSGYGFDIGLDYTFEQWIVGAFVSWQNQELDYDVENPGTNFQPSGNAGSNETDSIGLTLYAARQLGEQTYVDFSFGYVSSEYDFERRALFQESNRAIQATQVVTSGEADGRDTWAAVSLGHTFRFGAWGIIPSVGVTHSEFQLDSYTERDLSSSGLALNVDSSKQQSTLLQGGVKFTYAFSGSNAVWQPELQIDYISEMGDKNVTTNISFQQDNDNNTLSLQSDSRDRQAVNVGMGIVVVGRNGWSGFLQFKTTLGLNDLDRKQWLAGLRVTL